VSDRASIKITVDSSDAREKLTDLWWRAARLACPLLSEDELEEMARAELGIPGLEEGGGQ
jgi:hypothetical protein